MRRYYWAIEAFYDSRVGWEIVSNYNTRREAMADLRAYREAEPEFRHRICRKREQRA